MSTLLPGEPLHSYHAFIKVVLRALPAVMKQIWLSVVMLVATKELLLLLSPHIRNPLLAFLLFFLFSFVILFWLTLALRQTWQVLHSQPESMRTLYQQTASRLVRVCLVFLLCLLLSFVIFELAVLVAKLITAMMGANQWVDFAIIFAIGGMAILMCWVCLFYAGPLLAATEVSFRQACKSSLLLTSANIIRTFLLYAVVVISLLFLQPNFFMTNFHFTYLIAMIIDVIVGIGLFGLIITAWVVSLCDLQVKLKLSFSRSK